MGRVHLTSGKEHKARSSGEVRDWLQLERTQVLILERSGQRKTLQAKARFRRIATCNKGRSKEIRNISQFAAIRHILRMKKVHQPWSIAIKIWTGT